MTLKILSWRVTKECRSGYVSSGANKLSELWRVKAWETMLVSPQVSFRTIKRCTAQYATILLKAMTK